MYIQKIEVQNIRGITSWGEKFGEQNVRILGPNGSGKSSVIQSVEFALTGDISRLRGSGTQDIPFSQYASHVEAEPEEAWVAATFATNGSRDIEIKRWVSDPDNPTIVSPEDIDTIPDWLQKQMDAAKLGHSILDRDRLLRFVTAPEGERGDRIDELFGIEHIDKKRKSLKHAARSYEKESIKSKSKEKEQADKRFFELFPAGISTRSKAVEYINDRREEQGVHPIESLDDEITGKIEISDKISIDALQSEGTVKLLNRITDGFRDTRQQGINKYNEIDDLVSSLDDAETPEKTLNTLDLIEKGIPLLDEYDGECPLCLADWDNNEIREHLQERRAHASRVQSLKDDIDSAYEELNGILVEYTDDLAQLQSEIDDDYPAASRELETTIESANSWKDELNDGTMTNLPSVSELERVVFPDSLLEEIQQLVQIADEKPEVRSSVRNIELLAKADDRYEELRKREADLEEAKAVYDALDGVKQHFMNARSRVLNEAFNEICEKFETYYQEIHRDEEAADFSAMLEPTDTGVKFELKFYDQGHHHPGAVHSEGHRDSMGLALFLAMSDVGGDDIDILLLDDVMMSIDSGHRSNIANLLAEKVSDDYQILLTTHDKTWNRHLHLTQEFNKQVRFSKCSLEGGPLPVASLSDPWTRIDHHIEHDDVTAAAAWIRKTVEWYSRRACANLKASVPYHELEDETLSLGRLYQSALKQYESLIENGSIVDETEYGQGLYSTEDVQDELDAIQEVKEQKDRHLKLLHKNVHYNDAEAAFYTGEELKNERDVFKKAYNLLHCSDCNSWVKKGDYVYCDCTIRVKP
ncbi:hypothetical protein EGH24_12270 [Halonotius terrestris]|uniref:RecF/RecN/SMC N-terminal domain-containing protein n=1 Tax=Halonotius terrestris TaxID=2487750 RepID=A0A8J8PA47_9EURY|nr:AAA family ATPase [Halonotius terrestris]TQQ79162.1 hypothetical protein EGH24_12270 [Halonotius terrestris]